MSRSAHQKNNADRNTMTGQYNTADNSGEDEEFTFRPPRESERDNSEDSPTEKDHDGEDPSPDGDKENSQEDSDDDKKPFHDHPRWKEREEEWNRRFNEQETRHQDELKKALQGIRDEFSEKREENAEQKKIPSWFGGNQEQWDAYRADRDAELRAAEERARKSAIEELGQKAQTEDKAVKEATDYMNAELEVLSKDKDLNPEKLKIDANALVKFTIENELVDTKGRWNYRAAFKMMKASGLLKAPTQTTTVTKERKVLADASAGKDSKGEPTQKTVKSSLDFKKPGARPW